MTSLENCGLSRNYCAILLCCNNLLHQSWLPLAHKMYACSVGSFVLMNPVMTMTIKRIPVSIKHEADNISEHLKRNSTSVVLLINATSRQNGGRHYISVGSPRNKSVIAVGTNKCRPAADRHLLSSKSRRPLS